MAARELQTTDISVIEAAHKYGYKSPENFSEDFSQFHGTTSRQAKRKGTRTDLCVGGGLWRELLVYSTIGELKSHHEAKE